MGARVVNRLSNTHGYLEAYVWYGYQGSKSFI